MDKRQKRTNNYLKKGLTQLLSTQNYSDITIQQLAEASHINRSTFYLHYQSKDDFIVSIIDETITELLDYVKRDSSSEDAIFSSEFKVSFYKLLEYIEMNYEFIRVLFINMNNTRFRSLLVEKVRENIFLPLLEKNHVSLTFKNEIALNFIIHGHLGVIERLINDNVQYSSHYIAQVMLEIANTNPFELLGIESELEER